MRTMSVSGTHRRVGRTARSPIAARVIVRPSSVATVRRTRRTAGDSVASAPLRTVRTEPRPSLDRVRPLRVIPRGVVPYVKH